MDGRILAISEEINTEIHQMLCLYLNLTLGKNLITFDYPIKIRIDTLWAQNVASTKVIILTYKEIEDPENLINLQELFKNVNIIAVLTEDPVEDIGIEHDFLKNSHILTFQESTIDNLYMALESFPSDNGSFTVNNPLLDKTSGQKDEESKLEKIDDEETIENASLNEVKDQLTKKSLLQKDEFEVIENRAIRIREEFASPIWKKRQMKPKTVAVWSPLHRTGITTFTINFALFVSQFYLPVAVIEGISRQISMQSYLSTYMNKPTNWLSYGSYLKDGGSPEQLKWSFHDVQFFPLSVSDLQYEWTDREIGIYVESLKFYDLLLVDVPSGEISEYTQELLHQVDEIWLIVNNDLIGFNQWKKYMNRMLPEKKTQIIFFDNFPESQPEKIADTLGYPLLESFPSLYQEIAVHHYKQKPLYFFEGVQKKVDTSFANLLAHLTNKKISIEENNIKRHSSFFDFILKYMGKLM